MPPISGAMSSKLRTTASPEVLDDYPPFRGLPQVASVAMMRTEPASTAQPSGPPVGLELIGTTDFGGEGACLEELLVGSGREIVVGWSGKAVDGRYEVAIVCEPRSRCRLGGAI